jgi:hypothetical protein
MITGITLGCTAEFSAADGSSTCAGSTGAWPAMHSHSASAVTTAASVPDGGVCGKSLRGQVKSAPMKRSVLIATLFFAAGCLEPVDPAAPTVASCTGECPFGECSNACDSRDASTDDPAEALNSYSCAKEARKSCSNYRAETFSSEQLVCPPTPGSFCVTLIRDGKKLAVECSDAGQQVTVCTGFDPCDGGMPAPCKQICNRKTYCVR